MVVFTLEQRWEVGQFWQKKNHLSRWSSVWSWRVCKQAKLLHLGYRKPARLHWKADAPKTSHCLVQILVQRHNWTIIYRKWTRRGRYSQFRSSSGHVVRIFVHKNWRREYWQYLVSTGRRCYTVEATLDVTRLGCVGFSMYACELSMSQMLQFCLFTYTPRSKWASSE